MNYNEIIKLIYDRYLYISENNLLFDRYVTSASDDKIYYFNGSVIKKEHVCTNTKNSNHIFCQMENSNYILCQMDFLCVHDGNIGNIIKVPDINATNDVWFNFNILYGLNKTDCQRFIAIRDLYARYYLR